MLGFFRSLTQKMIYRLQIKKKENHCYSNSLSKLGIGEDEHKINTWERGTAIPLKNFMVDGVWLHLDIYPYGYKDEDFVSLYLH